MTDWRSVPVPRRMRGLQKDRRGYPVPFVVLRDSDGKPHFTINNSVRAERCVREKRCAICGGRLGQVFWLVGGPASAFHVYGAYIDPPLHQECMEYALQVCPYLAAPNYSGRIDAATLDRSKLPQHAVLLDSTMIPERPLVFVAVATRAFEIMPQALASSHVRPHRPYAAVQYWRQGSRLSDAEGQLLVESVMKEAGSLWESVTL